MSIDESKAIKDELKMSETAQKTEELVQKTQKRQENAKKPEVIKMPSEGYKFMLNETKFEVIKSSGLWFKARAVK